ncbi:MAG TPA: nucleotidyltransferase [Phycisphaerae bacterium]|nr:nucleotidyltransferase [Phycisphaerae bacterium]
MDTTLDILRRLSDAGVEYVIVGGVAAVAHGSHQVTEDLDVCAPLTRENVARILAALEGLNPCWRMLPARPPMPLDVALLATYKNLYIVTDWGVIDILSEITGVGDYALVAGSAVNMSFSGIPCRVISIDALIAAKKAIGRSKDLRTVVELEAIRSRC